MDKTGLWFDRLRLFDMKLCSVRTAIPGSAFGLDEGAGCRSVFLGVPRSGVRISSSGMARDTRLLRARVAVGLRLFSQLAAG
jgi:hypothetical protein